MRKFLSQRSHHTPIERLAQLGDVANRTEGHAMAQRIHARNRRIERLDLQAIDADHRMTVVHQVVGQREPGRSQAYDQHAPPGRRLGIGAMQIEWIPAREERIDLEAPRQLQDVLQRAGLGLRDIDRLLLLIDAGLHAVIADAVAGGRHHRVVDGDDAKRGKRLAAYLDHVELGDLLLERATGERHAEDRLAEGFCRRFLLQAFRARVLVLLVAPDAVVRLVERADQVGAGIGERKPFAVTQMIEPVLGKAARRIGVHRHQAHEIELARRLEEHALRMPGLSRGGRGGPRGIPCGRFQLLRVRCLVLQPPAHLARKLELRELSAEEVLGHGRGIEARDVCRLHLVQRAPLHELPLHGVERRELVMPLGERLRFALDAKQLGGEILDVRCECDQQLGLRIARRRLSACNG